MQKRSPAARVLLFARAIVIGGLFGFGIPMMLDPLGKLWFGNYGWIFSDLAYCFLFGLLMKVILLGQLAKTIDIEPQTPEEFAGVRDKIALKLAPAAPLPEVPTAGSVRPKKEKRPELDFQKLEASSVELATLGFTMAIEGAVKTGKKNGPSMFERMFVHPSGAFVELYQVFPVVGNVLPLSVSFFTYYPDGWSVANTTQKAHWLYWLWRRPRALAKGHEDGTTIPEIWSSHLALRGTVEAGLDLKPEQHSLQKHLDAARDHLVWMRRTLIRRSLLVAMIQHRFFRPKNREWWGEFHKFAKL